MRHTSIALLVALVVTSLVHAAVLPVSSLPSTVAGYDTVSGAAFHAGSLVSYARRTSDSTWHLISLHATTGAVSTIGSLGSDFLGPFDYSGVAGNSIYCFIAADLNGDNTILIVRFTATAVTSVVDLSVADPNFLSYSSFYGLAMDSGNMLYTYGYDLDTQQVVLLKIDPILARVTSLGALDGIATVETGTGTVDTKRNMYAFVGGASIATAQLVMVKFNATSVMMLNATDIPSSTIISRGGLQFNSYDGLLYTHTQDPLTNSKIISLDPSSIATMEVGDIGSPSTSYISLTGTVDSSQNTYSYAAVMTDGSIVSKVVSMGSLCSPGTYGTPGSNICLPCAPGTYSDLSYRTGCLDCPAGMSGGTGATSCSGGTPVDYTPRITLVTPYSMNWSGGNAVATGKNFIAGMTLDMGPNANLEDINIVSNATVRYAIVPPLNYTGYLNLTALRPDGLTYTYERAIYFAVSCVDEGYYAPTPTTCVPCPTGAFCPGGPRLWPLPGWWNPGEFSGGVTQCVLPEACLGGRDSTCAEGYESAYCGQCSDGYNLSDGVCQACPNDLTLSLLVLAQIGLLALIALVVMFASDRIVINFGFTLCSLKQIWGICGQGATGNYGLPPTIQTILGALDFFAGDLAFISPGCLNIGGFTELFFTNEVILLGICAIVLVYYVLWYKWRVRRAYQTEPATNLTVPRQELVFCAQRAFGGMAVIVGYVFETVTVYAWRGVFCLPDASSDYFLQYDQSVTCFEGTHILVFVVSIIIVIGALLFLGFQAMLAYGLRNHKQMNMFSHFFAAVACEDFKEKDAYAGVIITTALDFGLGLIGVFILDNLAQMVLSIMFCLVPFIYIIARRPFEDPEYNMGTLVIIVACILGQLSQFAMSVLEDEALGAGFMWGVIALMALFIVYVVLAFIDYFIIFKWVLRGRSIRGMIFRSAASDREKWVKLFLINEEKRRSNGNSKEMEALIPSEDNQKDSLGSLYDTVLRLKQDTDASLISFPTPSKVLIPTKSENLSRPVSVIERDAETGKEALVTRRTLVLPPISSKLKLKKMTPNVMGPGGRLAPLSPGNDDSVLTESGRNPRALPPLATNSSVGSDLDKGDEYGSKKSTLPTMRKMVLSSTVKYSMTRLPSLHSPSRALDQRSLLNPSPTAPGSPYSGQPPSPLMPSVRAPHSDMPIMDAPTDLSQDAHDDGPAPFNAPLDHPEEIVPVPEEPSLRHPPRSLFISPTLSSAEPPMSEALVPPLLDNLVPSTVPSNEEHNAEEPLTRSDSTNGSTTVDSEEPMSQSEFTSATHTDGGYTALNSNVSVFPSPPRPRNLMGHALGRLIAPLPPSPSNLLALSPVAPPKPVFAVEDAFAREDDAPGNNENDSPPPGGADVLEDGVGSKTSDDTMDDFASVTASSFAPPSISDIQDQQQLENDLS